MCALKAAIVGSEDKDVHCFKEQGRCHTSLELLTQQIKLVSELEDNTFVPDNDIIVDSAPREMVVDEDEKGDSETDIDKVLFDHSLGHVVLLKSFHTLLFERYFVLLKVPC